MRVLLAEDNHRLNNSLKMSLMDEGYAVDAVFNGMEAQEFAELTPYDVIVLDVMLPGRDGFAVCRELRRQGIDAPIVMLTARDSVEDRVQGLDGGADDYVIKPFAMQELLARLRAQLRRDTSHKNPHVQVADLILDPATHHVERAGRPIRLTTKEYALLEYFMRNPDRLITRDMAESHIWSYDYQGGSNIVDVYVRRLRRKIDDPFTVKLFETVRGAGYRLCPSGQ